MSPGKMNNYRVSTVPFGTPAQWRACRMIRLRLDRLRHSTRQPLQLLPQGTPLNAFDVERS
jgi:hypothetical protein